MTYGALATVAALSSLGGAAIVLSVAAMLLSGLAARGTARYAPRVRAGLLFRLRVLPGAGAAIAGFAIALPTFIAFEPFDTDEPLPRTMIVLASVGLALIVRGVWRGYSAWRSTERIAADWTRSGRRIDLGTSVPVHVVDVPYPLVAVVGIARPALFVAERVLAECPAGEVHAMIAHEIAHIRTFDNARRLLLRVCPDLMGERSTLTRAWKDAAEEAADADVAPGRSLDLAQALIHVARLAPSRPPALASAFYAGGSIDARVRRLVNPPGYAVVPMMLRGWVLAAAAASLAVALILAAPAIHQLMETIVRLVP
jgi:hypothetical protein